MNISSHLLHRSLASDRPPPGTELSQVVTACLYNDVNYDSEARFCANKSGLTGHSKGINCIGIDGTEGRWAVTGGADGSLLVWDLERQDREHDTNAVGFVRQYAALVYLAPAE
ncbi:hypothetical protein DRE_06615 [Drechslerella stenobrocha 248]|uniref:Uncharacterized protein n=1 Tax=Drechslerella stenobrocha 248 TaxID=1043628 RepID=W7HKV5_9PEZI|nr:hypothetical protein DRE_06615 [Drechslerella stenobrocha 248]